MKRPVLLRLPFLLYASYISPHVLTFQARFYIP